LIADVAGFGGLSISTKGAALLSGTDRFHYRPPEKLLRATGRRTESAPGIVDDALFAALKSLRLRIAKERAMPAYLVFSDRTLIDMAARRPRNLEEMAQVNGVGSTKLNEFGAMFITAIAAHPQVARV
jgi:ATP-dependent DNA helicase RecQ